MLIITEFLLLCTFQEPCYPYTVCRDGGERQLPRSTALGNASSTFVPETRHLPEHFRNSPDFGISPLTHVFKTCITVCQRQHLSIVIPVPQPRALPQDSDWNREGKRGRKSQKHLAELFFKPSDMFLAY